MKMKKILACLIVAAMSISMAACTGKTVTTDATTKASEATAAATTAATTAAVPETTAAPEQVTISFSWWGGDTRHEATLAAVDAFMLKYPYITVESEYGAWDGWEDGMSTRIYAGTAPDVNQINWNWITSFSSDGSAFLDLNTVADTIDLTQFSESALAQCTVADELQAIPASMTGRIFYWNKTAFESAGIATPTTLAELMAAGETFKSKLGDDYYPLAMGEYDRMILLVYYLESVYGKDWVVDNKVNYTQEEIEAGLTFIQSLEDAHVIPSIETILGDGAASLDKNPKWMEGKYAGIFEWDSSASKFASALNEGQELIVGDYLADMGPNQGGFSKVSLGFAISENTANPKECAMLINFLLNEPEGVTPMASERGIPLSAVGLTICTDNELLNAMVSEANGKVLAWTKFNLDPKFESAALKSSDGVYYDVMAGLSYGDYSASEAAAVLIEGVNEVLSA